MHSLFLREHNLIASWVGQIVTDWSDEEIFQYTRQIVAAEIQNIAFSQFLPIVLGPETITNFGLSLPDEVTEHTSYNPQTNPSIFNNFATAAFRFGHSLIPNMFLLSQTPLRTKKSLSTHGKL